MSDAWRQTAAVDLDQEFCVDATVAKAYINETTGERFICGVATGIEEDRDGERVSARAIRKMADTPTAGGAIPLMAATHVEDWANEIGEVTKLEHDAEHDELRVECKLPPAGVDPLADKAWHTLTVKKRQMGFSIGGKLKSAFYELGERAGNVVKRKVLDEIALRHMTLTGRPAYPGTFAEAVAKTWDGTPPEDDDEFVEVEIAKAKTEDDEPEGEQPEPEPAGEGDEEDAPEGADPEEPSDAEAAKDLPEGEGKRHLACPNCGHEFAAPLSSDLAENRSDTSKPDSDDDEDTSKMATATTTSLDDALARVREIADVEPVEKTEVETPEVAKTATETDDVAKAIAAVDDKVSSLGEDVAKAVGQLVDVVKQLKAQVDDLPLGRKSVAKTAPGETTPADPANPAAAQTREELVEKTAANPDAGALDVLKAMNVGATPRPIAG